MLAAPQLQSWLPPAASRGRGPRRRSCRCRAPRWTRSAGTQCDVILVTGDAYVDHPSFGMAIDRPRCSRRRASASASSRSPTGTAPKPFKALGRPRLFFGVTAGNMDSMVNRYTSDRRVRSDDAYTPGGEGGKRPDRSVIVYAQRAREAFRDVPIVHRRHRGLAAPHRALRLLVGQGAPLDPARRQGRPAASTATPSARSSRSRTASPPAKPIDALSDIRGTAFVRRGLPAAGSRSTRRTSTPGR